MRIPAFHSWSAILAAVLVLALTTTSIPAQKQTGTEDLKRIAERVERGATVDERKIAIQELGRFQSAAARRFLISRLKREDAPALRVEILRALWSHDHASVDRASRQLFESTEEARGVRSYAARMLARRSGAGIKVLRNALKSEDDVTWDCAVNALKNSKLTEARDALFRTLKKAEGGREAGLAFALRHSERTEAMVSWLGRTASDAAKGIHVRAECARQLATVDPDAAIETAVELASDDAILSNVRARSAVVAALVIAFRPKYLDLILDLAELRDPWVDWELKVLGKENAEPFAASVSEKVLQSEDVDRRRLALRILSILPGGSGTVGLIAALDDEAASVVVDAIQMLARRGVPELVATLTPLREHEDPSVFLAATHALHALRRNEESWLAVLDEDLQSESMHVLMCALDLCGDLEYRGGLQKALACFAAEDWRLRSAAYAYCVAVPARESVAPLIARLSVEDGRLLSEVHEALLAITGKRYGPKREYWQRWWTAAESSFAPVPRVAKSEQDKKPTSGATTFYGVPVVSKHICFVVDTSGSMAETDGDEATTRLDTALRQIRTTIDGLEPDVAIGVVAFAGDAKRWEKELRTVDDEAKKGANDFAATFVAEGGTNIHDAMRLAFGYDDVDTIYLLTDGAPSVGEIIDADLLADEIAHWNHTRRITIHTVSIGTSSAFLERVADDAGGVYAER